MNKFGLSKQLVCVLIWLVWLVDQTVAHRNVLGNDLEICSESPLTGFRRTGLCETDENDQGVHLVCAQVTREFLCLCVYRWYEAYINGQAPPVVLAASHERTLDHLRQYNLGLNNLSDSQAFGSRPQQPNGHHLDF